MFTGIIQEVGTVVSAQRGREADRLVLRAPKTADGLALGESVAVNGVCLSAVAVRQGAITFDVVPETQRVTSLATLTAGRRVNLERSLALTDRLNGHLVLGHVDGIATVGARRETGSDVALDLRLADGFGKLLVPKGPIAVDGVSLTVGALSAGGRCTVYLIPETLRRTTLSERQAGDPVNIELDYVAKLLVAQQARRPGVLGRSRRR